MEGADGPRTRRHVLRALPAREPEFEAARLWSIALPLARPPGDQATLRRRTRSAYPVSLRDLKYCVA